MLENSPSSHVQEKRISGILIFSMALLLHPIFSIGALVSLMGTIPHQWFPLLIEEVSKV